MSWASEKEDSLLHACLDDECSVGVAVRRAIRETIEECAARCTWRSDTTTCRERIIAMLEDK